MRIIRGFGLVVTAISLRDGSQYLEVFGIHLQHLLESVCSRLVVPVERVAMEGGKLVAAPACSAQAVSSSAGLARRL